MELALGTWSFDSWEIPPPTISLPACIALFGSQPLAPCPIQQLLLPITPGEGLGMGKVSLEHSRSTQS